MPGRLTLALLFATALFGQKYNGPQPEKPDLPYLVHADNLVATEAGEAKQETRKNDILYVIDGATSPAATPLASPIFLIRADQLVPDKLEIYKLESKNGRREVTMSQKRTRGGPRPLRLSVTRLDKGLYRVEAAETLENGQYSISPNDSNHVFCFEVY